MVSKYFHIEILDNDFVRTLMVPSRDKYKTLQLRNLDENFPLKNFNINERICFMPGPYETICDKAYEVKARSDDIWIVTYPKSGTTWAQEMIWLILNNFDFKKALSIDLTERSPFLEISGLSTRKLSDSVEAVNNLSSPRLIKSHMPASFLPKSIWSVKPKIIYIARNPKDVCMSYYHHWKGMIGYEGSKEEFVKAFISDNMNFAPYWDHIREFNELKDEKNILYLTFEEMKEDLVNVIKKCCEFLGKNINAEQLEELKQHLSFENMSKNPQVSHSKEIELFEAADGSNNDRKEPFEFISRRFHQDELSDELLNEFDYWINEMKIKCNLL